MAKKPQIIEDLAESFQWISLINFCLFCLNVWTTNARKLIKGSKDSYYSLESKKILSYKIGSIVRLQGLMTSSKCKQICINILSLCKHQQKPEFSS